MGTDVFDGLRDFSWGEDLLFTISSNCFFKILVYFPGLSLEIDYSCPIGHHFILFNNLYIFGIKDVRIGNTVDGDSDISDG